MGTDPGPRGTGSDSGRRIGVLISGRGSNLQALIDAVAEGSLDTQIAVVISNKADAGGLNRARAAGIETLILDHRSYASRGEYDAEIARELKARGVLLVCLAGFMRLIGTPLLEAFPNAILNVHPSLLPAFPGVDAQRQALEHGVKVSGATVHLVTGELDGGPIVLQSAVPVRGRRHRRFVVRADPDRRAPDLSGSRTHRPRRPVARGRQTVSRVHRRDDESRSPHAGNQTMPDAVGVGDIPIQILPQEGILEDHAAENQRRHHETDAGGEP